MEKGKRADWRQQDNELSEGPDEFQQHDCVEAPFSTMGETLQLLRGWVQECRQDPEGGFHSRWVGRMRGQRSWETQVWLPCVSNWTYPNTSLDLQPQTHFSPPAHWGVFLPHLSRWWKCTQSPSWRVSILLEVSAPHLSFQSHMILSLISSYPPSSLIYTVSYLDHFSPYYAVSIPGTGPWPDKSLKGRQDDLDLKITGTASKKNFNGMTSKIKAQH